MKMTMDSHLKNLEGSHKDSKLVSIRKMSDQQYERELDEKKAQLNVLMELLQKNEKNWRYGWNMRKMIKWNVEILWAKKKR